MLTNTPHLFDDATKITAGDSCWQGKTSPDYWAFVGPFGGCTAATILRALIDHPQRAGDPLSLTVNFCAPIAEGGFDLDVRLDKANRSSQHWCVEMTQAGGEVATLATAVFAERRPSWSHQQEAFPGAAPFEQARTHPRTRMTWTHQYDFRFVEGEPDFYGALATTPLKAFSKAVDRRSCAAKDRHAVTDVDVGRLLRPGVFGAAGTDSLWHGLDHDLFSYLVGRTCSRGHPSGSRGSRRQNLPQELWRPER